MSAQWDNLSGQDAVTIQADKRDVRKSLDILKWFLFAVVVYSAYFGGHEKKLGNLGKSI